MISEGFVGGRYRVSNRLTILELIVSLDLVYGQGNCICNALLHSRLSVSRTTKAGSVQVCKLSNHAMNVPSSIAGRL